MTSRRAPAAVVAATVPLLIASCTDSGETAADTPSTAGSTATPTAPPSAVIEITTIGAPTGPSPTVSSDGRTVEGDGFIVELPNAWRAYTLAADGAVRPLDAAVALAGDLENLATAAALQGASLFAVAPSADGGPATLLVTAVGADDQPAAAEVSDALRDRLAGEGVTDLRVDVVDIGGRRVARATFRQVGETGAEQEAVTVYVPGERTSFMLAFSTPLPLAEAASTFVDEILRSFRTS